MSDWEQFQTAYQKASPELKGLVDSEKIPTCVEASLLIRQGAHLQSAVTVQISYFVIGAQTIDTTISSLKQVGIVDAIQFVNEIQNCLQLPISNPVAVTVADVQKTPQPKVSTTLHDSAVLQPVRTMSHDMAAIKPGSDVVYQSSQADILARYNNVQPEMTPPPAETPRWDTDSTK